MTNEQILTHIDSIKNKPHVFGGSRGFLISFILIIVAFVILSEFFTFQFKENKKKGAGLIIVFWIFSIITILITVPKFDFIKNGLNYHTDLEILDFITDNADEMIEEKISEYPLQLFENSDKYLLIAGANSGQVHFTYLCDMDNQSEGTKEKKSLIQFSTTKSNINLENFDISDKPFPVAVFVTKKFKSEEIKKEFQRVKYVAKDYYSVFSFKILKTVKEYKLDKLNDVGNESPKTIYLPKNELMEVLTILK